MGPADMDEPGPGHGHAQEDEDPPEPGPASTDDAVGPTGDVAGSAPGSDAAAAGAAGAGAAGTPAAGAAGGGAADPPVPPGAGPAAPMPPDHHRGRKKKILAWTAGGVAVVVLLALGGAYAVYRHLNGNIHQVNISGELGTQPVDTHPQAENIMVIGSDTRNGVGKGYGQGLTTDQSDTLMIMHISADRKWADVMSIPRDSWVNIPACKMGNGQMSSPTTFKINEALRPRQPGRQPHRPGRGLHDQDPRAGHRHPHRPLRRRSTSTGFRDMVNALGGVDGVQHRPDQRPQVRICTCRPGTTCCTATARWPTSAPGTPSATAATWSGSAVSRRSCPRWSAG